MLGNKRKRTLASLLSIVLALSCVLSTVPVGAYDAGEQVNANSSAASEGLDSSQTSEDSGSESSEPAKDSDEEVSEPAKDSDEESSKPVEDSDVESSESGEDSSEESSEPATESGNGVLEVESTTVDVLADDERVNLAAGMKYTGTEPYKEGPTASYPDTGNKELTDGIYGASDYKDAMYVGYAGGNRDMELIFDFGYNQTFDEIKLYYACMAGAGVVPPSRVEVSYSSDKLNWTPWATGGPGEYGDTSHE